MPSGRAPGAVLRRFLLYFVAAYGPLTPVVLLFVIASPALVVVSGWSWWLKAIFIALDAGLLLLVAVWMGPKALREIQATLDAERRR
jgi:hypothetical protein